ncbi:MAG TPA: 3-phosphoshikimate 1-carboxyvinyltransferase [Membranihabitans sp.]|nr:3-phosphoshikimate 1-carboxyvinyltransferase [Membranihabitans sp.]
MSADRFKISFKGKDIRGRIELDGSKSISNRALIIQALTHEPQSIHHLSTSDDTQALQSILQSESDVYDTGAAGTTFRFLTAYLAVSGKSCTLTGSERMKQRPIGELVNALRSLGANIQYLEKEGYPPLRFEPGDLTLTNEIHVASHISSQFISALLLIAPALPKGLRINLHGEMVSRSYIELTLQIMKHYGIEYRWDDLTITVPQQPYQSREFTVESDWSAASYYYSIAALTEYTELELNGLAENSFQGDARVARLYESFGIETDYLDNRIILRKSPSTPPSTFQHNFILCPDIAQTMAVTCAALGTRGTFSGLQTLSIKETDRIGALQTELAKMGVEFKNTTGIDGEEYHIVQGKASFPGVISFPTYEDHRMAMSFAPLAILHPIIIEEPGVVSKSYPQFWTDLQKLGFKIEA